MVTKAILISGALLCRFAISCRLSLLHLYALRDMSSVFTGLYCLYITHYMPVKCQGLVPLTDNNSVVVSFISVYMFVVSHSDSIFF